VWTTVFAALAALPLLHVYGGRAGQALAAHGAMLRVDVRWSFAIAGLWAAASLVRAGMLVASGFRLHGIWKRAVPVEKRDVPRAGAGSHGGEFPLSAGSIALCASRGVALCTSRDVDRPSVIGFFSPRILIPHDLFERLSGPELEQIVLHELGHLRRRDDWMNLAQKLGLVLFPLNPVLAWIERRLCLERELACDDNVLRFTRAPKAYARCLTSLAEQRLERQQNERRAAALSLGAWERRSELGRRVHSILRGAGGIEGMGRVQARVAVGAVVLALVGGASELARCPRMVSFANATPVSQVAGRSGLSTESPDSMYRPVLSTSSNAAHETLLKASVPAAAMAPVSAVVPVAHRQGRRAAPARLERAKRTLGRNIPARARAQQWVVMTSWTSNGAGVTKVSRMVFTLPGGRGAVPTYAAVPAGDGWLVLLL
jgi:hypothetical protein